MKVYEKTGWIEPKYKIRIDEIAWLFWRAHLIQNISGNGWPYALTAVNRWLKGY
jgi:hypothetical protein